MPLREFVRGGRFDLPPMPADPRAIEEIKLASRALHSCPGPIRTSLHGPEPVAGHIDFDEPFIEHLPAHVAHCAMELFQSIVFDLGLPVILAGVYEAGSYQYLRFAVWLDLGTHRLLVLPSFTTHGTTMTFQLAHVVWHWQGWMTGHDPSKDEDWADLSTNYDAYFFRPGYAYYEASLARADNRFYWGLYQSGLDRFMDRFFGRWTRLWRGEVSFGDATYASSPVFFSKEMSSFFHFRVGDAACPEGSPSGVMLQRVAQCMAQRSQYFRAMYGPAPEEPQSYDNVRSAGRLIREEE